MCVHGMYALYVYVCVRVCMCACVLSYMTDGGVGIYTQRPANKEVLQHTTTSPADTDR